MRRLFNLFKEDKGEGFIDVLIKMLIVAIIGAALLVIMRARFPQVLTNLVDRIEAVFVF